MKKVITLITILSLLIVSAFAFSACGQKEEPATEEPAAEATTEETAEEEPTAEEATAETATEEPTGIVLAGTSYQQTSVNGEAFTITGDSVFILTFNDDGTFEFKRTENAVQNGTYEIEGSQLSMRFDDSTYSPDIWGGDENLANCAKEWDANCVWTINDDNTITREATEVPHPQNLFNGSTTVFTKISE